MMRSELNKKVKDAIYTLKAFDKEDEPYYLCYSGGKDSDTIRILAELAGVNYELHNNHTTVDSPTTVRYIRDVMSQYGQDNKVFENGEWLHKFGDKGFVHIPELSMWELIVKKKMPPTRLIRYCCEELKEKGGKGRRKVTGVRKAESVNRKKNQGLIAVPKPNKNIKEMVDNEKIYFNKKGGVVVYNLDNDDGRRLVESCYRTTSTLINPIIEWTDDDVWQFLKYYGCSSNPEYQCGKLRVGCIGCPMAGGKKQKKEFAKYPKYKQAYIHAFDRMLDARKEAGMKVDRMWENGELVMRWWVGDDPLQMTFDDYFKMQNENGW